MSCDIYRGFFQSHLQKKYYKWDDCSFVSHPTMCFPVEWTIIIRFPQLFLLSKLFGKTFFSVVYQSSYYIGIYYYCPFLRMLLLRILMPSMDKMTFTWSSSQFPIQYSYTHTHARLSTLYPSTHYNPQSLVKGNVRPSFS